MMSEERQRMVSDYKRVQRALKINKALKWIRDKLIPNMFAGGLLLATVAGVIWLLVVLWLQGVGWLSIALVAAALIWVGAIELGAWSERVIEEDKRREYESRGVDF